MKLFSKIINIIIIFALFYFCQPIVNMAQAATFSFGDLIKISSNTAVYYYGNNGARYVFPNENIYYSWYFDFSKVKTISDEEMAQIPIGGNIYYRPGTRLVKIESDPKVYAVEPQGILRPIASEQAAAALYGAGWAGRVDDLSAAFFGDYLVLGSLDGSIHPEGTLFNYSGIQAKYLLVEESGRLTARPIGSEAFSALRFRQENVLTISSSFSYDIAGQITASETKYADAGQFAFKRPSGVIFTRTDVGDRLIDRESSFSRLMKINISASEQVTVKRLSFKIRALTGDDDDLDPGGLVRGNNFNDIEPNLSAFTLRENSGAIMEVTDIGMDSDFEKKFFINGNLTLSAGQSRELWVTAKVDSDCPLGEKFKLYFYPEESVIDDASGLVINEIYPLNEISSNNLEVREGVVQISLGAHTASSDALGGRDLVDLGSFDFIVSGDGPVTVSKVAISGYIDENEGNADFAQGADNDDGDTTSFAEVVPRLYLYDGAARIAGPLATNSTGYFVFNNLDWSFNAAESRKLSVKGDISDEAPFEDGYDRVSVDIARADSDVSVTVAGRSVSLSGDHPNGATNPSVWINIYDNGVLIFQNTSGVPEQEIVVAGESKLIASYTVRALYEDIRINRLAFQNPYNFSDDCIDYVTMSYNTTGGRSGSKQAYVSGSIADYRDLGITIPAGGLMNVSLNLKTRSIESGCDSGDKLSFNLALDEEFEAWGTESLKTYDTTLIGDEHYIDDRTSNNDYIVMRKTEPTISFAGGNPSGESVRAMTEVLRFNIRANANEAVKLKKMTFKVTPSDVGYIGTDLLEYLADVNGDFFDDDDIINLYATNDTSNYLGKGGGGDIDYSIFDSSAGAVDNTPAGLDTGGGDYGIIKIEFLRGFEPIIAVGQTETYVLELDTVGLRSGDYNLRVDLLGDDGEDAVNFKWNDDEEDASGFLVDFLPLIGRYLTFD